MQSIKDNLFTLNVNKSLFSMFQPKNVLEKGLR